MVKEQLEKKIERYGAQEFHLGDAFIGGLAVTFMFLIIIVFNYDHETSGKRLLTKIESLERQVTHLQDENLQRIGEVGEVNNDLWSLEMRVKQIDSEKTASANRQEFFDFVERMIERSTKDGAVGQ